MELRRFNKRIIELAKKATLIIFVCSFILGVSQMYSYQVDASVPYESYNYNVWGESVPVPATYSPVNLIDGEVMGTIGLRSPRDLYVFNGDTIYILDSGNSRILILDSNFRVIEEIGDIESGTTDADGNKEYIDLTPARGIFVEPDGTLWIAMGEAGEIIVLESDGNMRKRISALKGDNVPSNLPFIPLKVAIGLDGTVYVASEGVFRGIIEMDRTGEFLGFFGSNRVDVTLMVVTEMFWKRIYSLISEDILESMIRIVPTEYSSIYMSRRGFIYAVSADSMNSMFEIKKLNPKGNNVLSVKPQADVFPGVRLNIGNYGDIETSYERGVLIDTRFTDVCVDENGFIFALDSQRGRIFKYDQESNLLAIFGGLQNQKGNFLNPVSVDTIDGKVIVLDSRTGMITSFEKTAFGESIAQATLLYNEGLYTEASEGWHEVLRQSANFELAYVGLGRAYMNSGEYDKAMHYFRLGYDKRGYDEAFTELRKDFLRRNLAQVFIGSILAAVALYAAVKFVSGKREALGITNKKILPVSYIMFSPFKASDDIRSENDGSIRYSLGILFVLLSVRVFRIGMVGFLFNDRRLEHINLLREIGILAGIYFAWILANWAVTTLMDGEGRVRDIVIITSNALIPVIIADVFVIAFSNVMTLREGVFLSLVSSLSYLWMVMILYTGIISIHRYSAGKAIVSMVLTIVGILLMFFLIALVFSLLNQMMLFFENIFTEIMYRI